MRHPKNGGGGRLYKVIVLLNELLPSDPFTHGVIKSQHAKLVPEASTHGL